MTDRINWVGFLLGSLTQACYQRRQGWKSDSPNRTPEWKLQIFVRHTFALLGRRALLVYKKRQHRGYLLRRSYLGSPDTSHQTMMNVRLLGIDYLWIECYCSIQGDDKDWKHEASKMYMVYANAHLNIGAAHVTGPMQRLFHDREPLTVGSLRWPPTGKGGDGPVWHLYIEVLYDTAAHLY